MTPSGPAPGSRLARSLIVFAGGLIVTIAIFGGLTLLRDGAGGAVTAPAFAADGAWHSVSLTAGHETGLWLSAAGITCDWRDPLGRPVMPETTPAHQVVRSYQLVAVFTPCEHKNKLM